MALSGAGLGCSASTPPPRPAGLPPTPATVTVENPGGDAFDPELAALDRLAREPWSTRRDRDNTLLIPLADARHWQRVRLWGYPTRAAFRFGDDHYGIVAVWYRPTTGKSDPESCLAELVAEARPIAEGYGARVVATRVVHTTQRAPIGRRPPRVPRPPGKGGAPLPDAVSRLTGPVVVQVRRRRGRRPPRHPRLRGRARLLPLVAGHVPAPGLRGGRRQAQGGGRARARPLGGRGRDALRLAPAAHPGAALRSAVARAARPRVGAAESPRTAATRTTGLDSACGRRELRGVRSPAMSLKTTNGAGCPLTPAREPCASPAPLAPSRIFAGKKLVVVGGTGFLGKVWVSMLLHRFPEIGHLYLLVRPKDEQTAEERFWSQIATSPVFDPIREQHPGEAFEAFLREKVTPIAGDVVEPLLGLGTSGSSSAARARSTRSSTWPAWSTSTRRSTRRSRSTPSASTTSSRWRGRSARRSCTRAPATSPATAPGLIEEVDPREVPFPRAEGETWYGAAIPQRTLERSHWDPQREIEECLDLVKQARHRCEDAFRQSALPRRGQGQPRGAAASRCRGLALDGRDRQGEAPVRGGAAHRGGHGARALLGLDQHLHVHEEHRRAGARRLGRALHHRAPGRHRVELRLPVPRLERGHQHLGAVPLHGVEGAGAVPRRPRLPPRHHPRRHGRRAG